MGVLNHIWLSGMERGLAWLDGMAVRRGLDRQPVHLRTGLRGEDAAYFYLRQKGYVVVARRWTDGVVPGDLDLVAWKGQVLCIVEVKTRTAHDIAPAEVTVGSHKRRVLRRLARQYLIHLPQEAFPPVRFDILSVYLLPGQPKEFVHFEAAFGWREFDPDWQ